MRIFLLLFLLTLTFSCATRNINYDRNKILKKYSTDYKMFVDDKEIDLETVYLDKNNIESVRIDKQIRELKITQLKPTKLSKIKEIFLDSLSAKNRDWGKKKIELLIVVDGVPLTDSLKIDTNAIKSFMILSQEKMNNLTICRPLDGVILITTK